MNFRMRITFFLMEKRCMYWNQPVNIPINNIVFARILSSAFCGTQWRSDCSELVIGVLCCRELWLQGINGPGRMGGPWAQSYLDLIYDVLYLLLNMCCNKMRKNDFYFFLSIGLLHSTHVFPIGEGVQLWNQIRDLWHLGQHPICESFFNLLGLRLAAIPRFHL